MTPLHMYQFLSSPVTVWTCKNQWYLITALVNPHAIVQYDFPIHSKSSYMHCAPNQWWCDCEWGHCYSGVCWLRTYHFLPVQSWPPEFLSMWAWAGYLRFVVGVNNMKSFSRWLIYQILKAIEYVYSQQSSLVVTINTACSSNKNVSPMQAAVLTLSGNSQQENTLWR